MASQERAQKRERNWASRPITLRVERQEQIDLCLNCPYPNCIDCLSGKVPKSQPEAGGERRQQFMELITQNYTNEEIARRMGCSTRNVRYYRSGRKSRKRGSKIESDK